MSMILLAIFLILHGLTGIFPQINTATIKT